MVDIILVKNIFEPRPDAEVISKDYIAGLSLQGYVDMTDKDAYVAGMWIKDPGAFYPKDNVQILVTPHVAGHGVKQLLGTVLMVGLMVAAPHWAMGIPNLFARALVTGAIITLGGKIINSIFHLNQAASPGIDDQSSQTYGWNLPGVQTQEGGVIGETFGECIPSPQLLMYHVETTNSTDQNTNNQYLNVLYCGGYGPVDSITDIRIGHTPIENFSDVQIETRLGTNNQQPISLFPNTVADMSISMSLTEGKPVIRSTDASNCNRVDVTFEFPSGLYRLKNDGNRENCTAHIRVDYRRTGTSTWIGGKDLYITRSTNSAVRYTQVFNGLESGRYDVKVTPISLPHSAKDSSYCTWSLLSCFTYDGAYERPNKVLVALRIKATSQLNGGVPDINWRQKRTTGYAWNPETQAYESVNLRNPVWAAYDILHHCRRLYNVNTQEYEYYADGCPKERFAQYWDQWQEAADYADEQVTNSDGSKEPRFRFDAYYDTALRRYEAANKALAVAHANLIRHGLQLGVVVDKPGAMHQIFGEGRTVISSVKGEFSATADRAHSLEVTYNDTLNDFKNTEFFVRSANYMSGQDSTAQLTLFGVSSRSQAYREAMYVLATNERQLQTIEFSADVNAMVCEYGDIIGVNSQVPRIGVASGRVVSVSGTTVRLDKKVAFSANEQYTVIFQLSANDKLITRSLVPFTADTATDTVEVSAVFDEDAAPTVYDNYVLGLKDRAAKPFRIVKIQRDGDQQVSITAVEYDEAIYQTDYSKYPKIDYATPSLLKAPINLTLTEQLQVDYAGVKTSSIYATWDMPENARYDEFHVYYSTDNVNWVRVNTVYGTCATVEGLTPVSNYVVRVCAVLDGAESTFATASLVSQEYVNEAIPPTNVTASGRYSFLSNGTAYYTLAVSWGPDDLDGQVWYKHTGTSVENAVVVEGVPAEQTGYSSDWTFAGDGKNQLDISPISPGETYKVAVCTANDIGDYTPPDAAKQTEIYVAPKVLIPNMPDNVKINFTDTASVSWDTVTNCDIKYYELRTDTNPGSDDVGLLARTNRISTTVPIKQRKGTIYVYACGTDYRYSVPAVLSYSKALPTTPVPDVQAGVGNIRIQVGPIPDGCLGVRFYINGQTITATNPVLNYAIKTKSSYKIAAAYYDLFGEGDRSTATTVDASTLVGNGDIEDGAVSEDKVDDNIKTVIRTSRASETRLKAIDKELEDIQQKLSSTTQGVLLCAGQASDGDTVVFDKALDAAPHVMLAPIYRGYDMGEYVERGAKQNLYAENVTMTGFSVVCNTTAEDVDISLSDSEIAKDYATPWSGTALTHEGETTDIADASMSSAGASDYHLEITKDVSGSNGLPLRTLDMTAKFMVNVSPLTSECLELSHLSTVNDNGVPINTRDGLTEAYDANSRASKEYTVGVEFLYVYAKCGYRILNASGDVLKEFNSDLARLNFALDSASGKFTADAMVSNGDTVAFDTAQSGLKVCFWSDLYLTVNSDYTNTEHSISFYFAGDVDHVAQGVLHYHDYQPAATAFPDALQTLSGAVTPISVILGTQGTSIIDHGDCTFIATGPNTFSCSILHATT